MKLGDIAKILYSRHGDMTFAVVYDISTDIDIESGCSVEYALAQYGDDELVRITADSDKVVLHIRRDI